MRPAGRTMASGLASTRSQVTQYPAGRAALAPVLSGPPASSRAVRTCLPPVTALSSSHTASCHSVSGPGSAYSGRQATRAGAVSGALLRTDQSNDSTAQAVRYMQPAYGLGLPQSPRSTGVRARHDDGGGEVPKELHGGLRSAQ